MQPRATQLCCACIFSALSKSNAYTIPCAIIARATLTVLAFRNPCGAIFASATHDQLLQALSSLITQFLVPSWRGQPLKNLQRWRLLHNRCIHRGMCRT